MYIYMWVYVYVYIYIYIYIDRFRRFATPSQTWLERPADKPGRPFRQHRQVDSGHCPQSSYE